MEGINLALNFQNIPDCVAQSCTESDVDEYYSTFINELNSGFQTAGLDCTASQGEEVTATSGGAAVAMTAALAGWWCLAVGTVFLA